MYSMHEGRDHGQLSEYGIQVWQRRSRLDCSAEFKFALVREKVRVGEATVQQMETAFADARHEADSARAKLKQIAAELKV